MSDATPIGRVFLVGAGPGDPGLLTLRGAEALRRADVVVYDALAASELLALARPDAELIDVGKRGHDAPTHTQADTTALLLRLAGEGRTVVRLKGGDPFVFGRGGEEASALAAAGIPFDIVPGVSSSVGALAYAGIPVTDRRHAASFAVLSGHKDPGEPMRETRWEAVAGAVDTIVLLMAMRNLEGLLERLLAGGRSPETPAAVVMEGALPEQRVVVAPLGRLAQRVRQVGLGAPAVVVIGEVVRLRDELRWWEDRPLFGHRVLVTRSPEQAGPLLEALRDAGALPVLLPMIEIAPPLDTLPLERALREIDVYDALLLTSANAVRAFTERAQALGIDLGALRAEVHCVGATSARAAEAAGLRPQALVSERFDSESLLAALERGLALRGRRFLFPCAEQARDTLTQGLRARGASVDAVVAYRTLAPPVNAELLCAWIRAGRLDVLSFASPSAVRNLLALLDASTRAALGACTLAAIGPTTAEALRKEGLEAQIVAPQATASALVEAIVNHFGGETR